MGVLEVGMARGSLPCRPSCFSLTPTCPCRSSGPTPVAGNMSDMRYYMVRQSLCLLLLTRHIHRANTSATVLVTISPRLNKGYHSAKPVGEAHSCWCLLGTGAPGSWQLVDALTFPFVFSSSKTCCPSRRPTPSLKSIVLLAALLGHTFLTKHQ